MSKEFFHVLVKTERDQSQFEALFKNLTKAELKRQVVRPYRANRCVLIGNKLVSWSEVLEYLIIKTASTAEESLAEYAKGESVLSLGDGSFVMNLKNDSFGAEYVYLCGENVTGHFLKDAPGIRSIFFKFIDHPLVSGTIVTVVGGIVLTWIYAGSDKAPPKEIIERSGELVLSEDYSHIASSRQAGLQTAYQDLFRSKVVKQHQAAPPYRIEISYPEFLRTRIEGSTAINSTIFAIVSREIASFSGQMVVSKERTNPVESSMHGEFEVELVSPHFVSIRLDFTSYRNGAMHPAHWTDTLVFDRAFGRRMSLIELFPQHPEYLEVLSKLCDQELHVAKGFRDGIEPQESNFSQWTLTSSGLRFYFDEYRVAPYVDGRKHVELGYASLKKLLVGGPLEQAVREKEKL